MKTITDSGACWPSATRKRDAESLGVPERITLQETIKFGVECLFGSVGGSWVYEQLGLADYLEERLRAAETVELIAVEEDVMRWNNTSQRPESGCDHKEADTVTARSGFLKRQKDVPSVQS